MEHFFKKKKIEIEVQDIDIYDFFAFLSIIDHTTQIICLKHAKGSFFANRVKEKELFTQFVV